MAILKSSWRGSPSSKRQSRACKDKHCATAATTGGYGRPKATRTSVSAAIPGDPVQALATEALGSWLCASVETLTALNGLPRCPTASHPGDYQVLVELLMIAG